MLCVRKIQLPVTWFGKIYFRTCYSNDPLFLYIIRQYSQPHSRHMKVHILFLAINVEEIAYLAQLLLHNGHNIFHFLIFIVLLALCLVSCT